LDAPFFPARHLDAKTYGVETCYLGAIGHGADPRVKRSVYVARGLNINFLKKKEPNCKKLRPPTMYPYSSVVEVKSPSRTNFCIWPVLSFVVSGLAKNTIISDTTNQDENDSTTTAAQ